MSAVEKATAGQPVDVVVDVVAGKLKAMVGGGYELSDPHRAQADFMAKKFIGKLIIVPDAKCSLV